MSQQKKILFVVRNDLDTKPGGDTVQIHQTKKELEKLGFVIDYLQTSENGNQKHYSKLHSSDLVHFFNLPLAHQYFDLVEYCKLNSIPFVLSTIFWDMRDFERQSRSVSLNKKLILKLAALFPSEAMRKIFNHKIKSLAHNRFYFNFLKKTLSYFDLILPNSFAEAECINNTFNVKANFHVVRNGARVCDKEVTPSFSIPQKFLLCVGRIEYRKNQLNLIKALKGVDIPLLLVGDVNSSELAYWSQCKKEAKKINVELHQIPNQPIEVLTHFYSRAIVHVQPSWFETPGLSSLEASAVGCPIVCTEIGCAKEYFQDYAEYCNPADIDTIRSAILCAINKPKSKEQIKNFILNNYTWELAAQETAQAYA
ncbi:MAG: glycosyltransferase, partial [Ignavibacteria bacterium]|nr:glycosyltransferase [Ignavibacteria bacterium]